MVWHVAEPQRDCLVVCEAALDAAVGSGQAFLYLGEAVAQLFIICYSIRKGILIMYCFFKQLLL